MFRFTITSKDNVLLSYWERNAPLFEERYEALQYCYREGFKTSVSIEPCLDLPKVSALVSTISPFVTEHIWIGIMKSVRLRVEVTTEEDKAMVTELLRAQSRDNVLRIYHQLKDDKKIMWKDSIKKIVEKAG